MTSVLDISHAVVLSRMLHLQRSILALVIICSAIFFLDDRGEGSLLTLAGGVLLFAIFQYPIRFVVFTWTLVLVGSAVVFAIWSCRHLVDYVAGPDFNPGVLLHVAPMLLAFYWLWKGFRKGSFKTVTPDVSSSFGVTPGFFDIWLSGGWRSLLVAGVLFCVSFGMAARADADINACGWLSFVLVSALAIPLALIPAMNAARNSAAVSLIRLIRSNRKATWRNSYFLFVAGNMISSPKTLVSAIGGTLLVLFVFVVAQSFSASLGVQNSPYSYMLGAALLGVWRRSCQQALALRKPTDPGSGPFTLFLRSFMDDEASMVAFFGILTFVRGKRVEELVAETVWPFGKMVALGRPGEALPQIGALRMETDLAKNWRAAIHSLISRASHVLMAAGISGGLKWELEQLQSEGNRGKCSLLILPEEGSIQATWRLFAAQNSRLLESPHEYVERALAVRFDSAGLPLFLCARKKSIEGYRVALNACFVPLEKLLSIYSAA